MKDFLKTLVAIVFVCFISNSLFAQFSEKEVDSIVNYSLEKFNVAGCAVAIVKDGKVVYSKGFGVKSVNSKGLVDEETNFLIGSNSKAFTTAALSILVDEGKLKWDDKVKDHIPEFKMYNSYVTENFNIQDLLTHRSGLGLGVGDLMIFPDGSSFTMDDLLSSFQHFKPVSAFRTKFDYDNLLYLVAGEVVKRVSGMSWEDFITNRIFKPLSMNNSYASFSRIKNHKNLAKPHDSNSGVLKILPDFEDMINGAAGGIYSNISDMSSWMIMHLNQGKYGEGLKNKIFTKKNQREMWSIHTVIDVDRTPRYNSHFSGYGLGWRLSDIKGNMSVSHTGGMPGMLSKVTMIPDLNLGVVVLTNTSNDGSGVFSSISSTIVDNYLGLEDYGWIDQYAAYFKLSKKRSDKITDKVWEVVKATNNSNIDIENYIGLYNDKWFGNVEVFMNGKKLWFKSLKSPKINGEMFYYQANTFAIKWEYKDMNADAFAMFALDEKGKAESIKMKGISPNIDFSFDFKDLDLKRIK